MTEPQSLELINECTDLTMSSYTAVVRMYTVYIHSDQENCELNSDKSIGQDIGPAPNLYIHILYEERQQDTILNITELLQYLRKYKSTTRCSNRDPPPVFQTFQYV